jgi:hypothetical protein
MAALEVSHATRDHDCLPGAALGAGGAPLSAQSKDQASRQTCDRLVHGSRMTDEGRRAFQELLTSGRAPELLDRLLHLAKGTGNGVPTQQ